jgi:hypothetical protein
MGFFVGIPICITMYIVVQHYRWDSIDSPFQGYKPSLEKEEYQAYKEPGLSDCTALPARQGERFQRVTKILEVARILSTKWDYERSSLIANIGIPRLST